MRFHVSRFFVPALMAVMPAAAVLLGDPITALAQTAEDTTVTIPIDGWLQAAGEFIGPLLAAAALWLIRKLPAQIAAVLMTMRVDQLLEKAISYGINAVVGATKDRPLTVDVGNAVVKQALQYVVDHAPTYLVSWMGGAEAIRQMIIARLEVQASASLA